MKARPCRTVAGAIVATSAKGAIVTAFSSGEFDIADLEAQPLPSLIAQVRKRGVRLQLDTRNNRDCGGGMICLVADGVSGTI